MSTHRKLAILASLVPLFGTHVRAQKVEDPWNFPDFSATEVIPMRGYEVKMKIYRSGSSVRIDRSPAISNLYIPSDNKTYRLTAYPDGSRQCVVYRPEQVNFNPTPLDLLIGTKVQRTPAGTETVEGHPCNIEVAEVSRPNGKTITSKVWRAQDLQGVPVKIESQIGEHKMTVFYRDIVFATPDKNLLTPPAKCTPYEKMWQVAEHTDGK